MQISTFMPSRLKVSLSMLLQGARDMRRGLNQSPMPVFRTRHSPGALREMSHEAHQDRLERIQNKQPPFQSLKVLSSMAQGQSAVSLVLGDPGGWLGDFKPGQYVRVRVQVGGETLIRAYSLCHGGGDEKPTIAVKRVVGGRLSNFLNDQGIALRELEVSQPMGRFTLPEDDNGNALILIGGGSGITPLLALAKFCLRKESSRRVHLIYGNRSPEEMLFAKQLDSLKKQYPNFDLRTVFEEPKEKASTIAGRLCGSVFDSLVPKDALAHYFVCGPQAMMQSALEHLDSWGIDGGQVHGEYFARSPSSEVAAPKDIIHSVQFLSQGQLLHVHEGETLLEAGLKGGLDLDFSCRMGGCAACKIKVVEGSVYMAEPNCLSESEREQSYVLACLAQPRSALTLTR